MYRYMNIKETTITTLDSEGGYEVAPLEAVM
jgi:hypothetical protein